MIGQIISHYRILEKLGQGGMGVVYRAEDTRLGRTVAVKFLSEAISRDRRAIERFLREARAASALNHPQICAVHDIGEHDGQHFIVMEFLEGTALNHLVSGRALPADQVLDIGSALADVLAAAHAKGIIHRDIKPANIFVTDRGVKLLDFGLAKPSPDRPAASAGPTEEQLTNDGAVLGTPAYMSPEQVRGEGLDARTDLFSLGAVLYEMSTGRMAFPGATSGTIQEAILNRPPVPVGRVNPEAPPRLEDVINKALEKDRKLRYQSASDLRADLQRLKRDSVSTGLPAARSSMASADASAEPEKGRRRRVRGKLLALFALALLGAALWAGLRPDTAAPTEMTATPVPITRFPGLELEPAFSPSGNVVAFAWDGQNEDNFDIYVRSTDGSQPLRLTTDASPDHGPAWSPDGQRIAFVRVVAGRRMIMVIPALGGPEHKLFEAWGAEGDSAHGGAWSSGGWSYGLSWTPDGGHLVYGDRNSSLTSAIYLYSLKDGQRRQLTRPPANLSDILPVVSPDGRYLAFVRLNPTERGGSVFLQKLKNLELSGHPTQLTSGHTVVAFDWAHDSRSIVHDAGRDPGLWRISVAGGASELVWANIRTMKPSLARSGAGVVYQTTAIDSNIWELTIATSPNRQAAADETFRVIASTSNDTDMKLSPDGTRIAFVSARSGHSDLWVANRDGSQARQLTNFGGWRTGSPSWSADGTSIAFDALEPGGNWSLYVVPADGSPISKPVISDRYNNVRPAWSPDGRWIYFASDRTGDYQIYKIPSAGGTPERITRNGGLDPIVSPDGRHLYYAKPVPVQGIWEVALEGGPEEKVVERGRSLGFDVADTGIFIMDASAKPQATVEMFSFASRKLVPVARLPAGLRIPPGAYLNVTRDGRSILYTRFDQWSSDIEMLPGVR